MSRHPTILWWPDEPEDDLYGFVTKEDRDACVRGEPGPFTRILRNLVTNPVTLDEQAVRFITRPMEPPR